MVDNERVTLTSSETGGLGELQLVQPPGSFALTPASRMALQAVGKHQHLLSGVGLDWGSGLGCLAIAAAQIAAVQRVIGLEIAAVNIAAAQENAVLNNVAEKTDFFLADSYSPYASDERSHLEAMQGQINFVLANPPSSEGDDGFGYRRVVLKDARPFLAPGAVVFLSVSYQYGPRRVADLSQQIPGFSYGGVLISSDWVPFDLQRPDLLHCLLLYAGEEQRGGPNYVFPHPEDPDAWVNAQTALANFRHTGVSPQTRWQVHLFRYEGEL